jgi:DNA-binding transcriptional MerR regulator
MAKAQDAFRTISEVADELAVQKHVLRFWENKFPHIRPMKRGGGRRFYRPDDLDLLRGIRYLLHREGYTIKGVQKILREQGPEHVKGCWQSGVAALQVVAPRVDEAVPSKRGAAKADVVPVVVKPGAKGRRQVAPPTTAEQLDAIVIELEAARLMLRGEQHETAAAKKVRQRRAR